jgi:hypothetical protein
MKGTTKSVGEDGSARLRLRRRIGAVIDRPMIYLPQRIVEATRVCVGDEVDVYVDDDKIIIHC